MFKWPIVFLITSISMHHKSKLYFQKTNHHASLKFLFVFSLILFNGYLINFENTYQNFFIFAQSLSLISLFAPLHECSHSTAFKSKLLNQLVMLFLRDGSFDAVDLVQGIPYAASPSHPGYRKGSWTWSRTTEDDWFLYFFNYRYQDLDRSC